MTKVINFPPKKETVNFIVPENDFNFLLRKLVETSLRDGRSQGFFIGVLLANILNFLIMYFTK
jgi:hypothetical protein